MSGGGIKAGRKAERLVAVRNYVFYLGLGFLFTHEMNAMTNGEWRVMPLLNEFSDKTGELIFLLAHVPVFAIVIAFIASMDARTRLLARNITCGFLVAHGALHYLFSSHPAYEFSAFVSELLIYGAAACGSAFLIIFWLTQESGRN
jgi:hypothetical protein